jgi:type IV secretory pathway VirB2 component (pilin)
MKLVISCIISILAKLLIIIGILFFCTGLAFGIMAPPWLDWLQDFSLVMRIIIACAVAGLVAYLLIAGGVKVSHFADRFIEKH